MWIWDIVYWKDFIMHTGMWIWDIDCRESGKCMWKCEYGIFSIRRVWTRTATRQLTYVSRGCWESSNCLWNCEYGILSIRRVCTNTAARRLAYYNTLQRTHLERARAHMCVCVSSLLKWPGHTTRRANFCEFSAAFGRGHGICRAATAAAAADCGGWGLVEILTSQLSSHFL